MDEGVMTEKPDAEWLTPQEAALELRVKHHTILAWVRRHKWAHVRRPSHTIIRIKRCCVEGTCGAKA